MSSVKRDVSLDIAKGIGIVLVVLGHTMSPVMSENVTMQTVYRVLYIFHMPLFFMLSGLVSDKLVAGGENSKSKLIQQRVYRLMIPYFSWAIIYSPMKLILKEQVRFQYEYSLWTILIGNNPDGQLWFLYVLFVFSVVTILFVNQGNLRWWCVITLGMSIVAPIIPSDIGLPGISLSFSVYQIGFFFAGIMLISKRDDAFHNTKLAITCLFLWMGYNILLVENINVWFLKVASACCACYCILYFSRLLSNTEIAKRIAFLGRNSMDIYIIHAPILVIGRTVMKKFAVQSPWLYVAVLTIVAVVSALLISKYIIHRIKPLRLLLLGIK